MDLTQPDLSKALMTEKDFELLGRVNWIKGTDGKLIYPAREFLRQPPKGTRCYNGGLVFKPAGNVADDEYNLYRGLLIEPDASG